MLLFLLEYLLNKGVEILFNSSIYNGCFVYYSYVFCEWSSGFEN